VGKGKERGSDYYDLAYSSSKAYYKLPEEIPEYYDMWMAGSRHVEYADPKVVIDLGCGAGHFGEIIRRSVGDGKMSFEKYYGYDFSTVALDMAKEMVKDPRFVFDKQDLYKFDFAKNKPSDSMYVSYEFLEHIEGDLDVLCKIPKGAYISFSVPSSCIARPSNRVSLLLRSLSEALK